jgi:hypothetical protein
MRDAGRRNRARAGAARRRRGGTGRRELATPVPRFPVLGGTWFAYRKPVPGTIDEWTHYLHGPGNNAVSHDRAVGPPRCLQWISDPVCGRHIVGATDPAVANDHNRLPGRTGRVAPAPGGTATT